MKQESLSQIYSKYAFPFGSGGGDKGTAHDYIGTYSREIDKRWEVSFVEIGVFRGDSMMMWNEYFIDSRVFGIDVSLDNVVYPQLSNVFVCDATSQEQVDSLFGRMTFDYVLDDGSHNVDDQISAFEIFYGRLEPGGKYFIEDILGDEALFKLEEYMKSRSLEYSIFDTRRPETTDNDIIMMVGA